MNEEIKQLLQTYQRGLNDADLDLVRSVYADDAVVIGQPFPTATGIQEIIALYADFLSKLDFNVQFELLEMELSNDLGFIRTRSHGTIVPKGVIAEFVLNRTLRAQGTVARLNFAVVQRSALRIRFGGRLGRSIHRISGSLRDGFGVGQVAQ
jgi:ketosteroid isomerase-like protein